MGRRPLYRRVNYLPRTAYFKPVGIRLAQLQETRLSIEEIEAMRLKDVEGLEQEECAKKMHISRSTFAGELNSGRQKIADALIHGKAIKIQGNKFEIAKRRFRYVDGHEREIPFEEIISTSSILCPACTTSTVMSIWPRELGYGKDRMGRYQIRVHT